MGYAHTNIVVYGIELEDHETELIILQLVKERLATGESDDMPDEMLDDLKDALAIPDFNLLAHDTGALDDIESWHTLPGTKTSMFSNDSDSRIHYLFYDPECYHTIGVECGSKGYGCNDDIMSIVKGGVTQKMIDSYKDLDDFLKKLGIKKEPDILMVGQVH
jgi:hypothetical protein